MIWKNIKTAPMDGTHIILGLWVKNNKTNEEHWESYVAYFDPECGEAFDQDGCASLPWQWDDFDAWCSIPKPPTILKTKG